MFALGALEVVMLLDTLKVSVVPQFFPAAWLEEYPIVFSDFPSGIRIGYVLREEGAYSYLESAFTRNSDPSNQREEVVR